MIVKAINPPWLGLKFVEEIRIWEEVYSISNILKHALINALPQPIRATYY
ncbi:hypothetical protein Marme_3727 [Marinomonas mediterranea MMB-1]|jgi:hypothetical protein|uniref:Uncharacterized protein n=1 Tax=Marinomonas mediterranea (strain ATCC 700492 / JCM 21426 / NBRC 103028 / MMB-1) TaxID=717774 RepID=F2JW49_MARM1|nr:hypothetical protein Marme_3727 [Marinomonas mediterranea MMB-1]